MKLLIDATTLCLSIPIMYLLVTRVQDYLDERSKGGGDE